VNIPVKRRTTVDIVSRNSVEPESAVSPPLIFSSSLNGRRDFGPTVTMREIDQGSPPEEEDETPTESQTWVDQSGEPLVTEDGCQRGIPPIRRAGQLGQNVHRVCTTIYATTIKNEHSLIEVNLKSVTNFGRNAIRASINQPDLPYRIAQPHEGDVGGTKNTLTIIDDGEFTLVRAELANKL
jgi:hypothetical protein